MKLCWHCEKRPAADNDLWVCDECWQEWERHAVRDRIEDGP
jgi:uncharacterized Zn ribbon protein